MCHGLHFCMRLRVLYNERLVAYAVSDFFHTIVSLEFLFLSIISKYLQQKETGYLVITTEMIQSFRRDRPGQTVQTQIRLFLEEQSDLGLHCLQFPLHLLDALLYGKAIMFNFYCDYSKFLGV